MYYGKINKITGSPHGRGIWIADDSSKLYEGQWQYGLHHGRGRKIWKIGSFFEGEWIENRRNGIGTKIWPSGSSYYGNWVNDNRTG